ncbi:hypothetical protein GWK47_047303 [Chionoecetes opilio]|uniref:Uncharacterized protein n=1 Tax=Chionoecetes opilio TaxID=41210 RepID=A0A8J4Y3U1_CHIOP|nr:hypothetical protein GWK47_047303 [Chionoecetes opilio]
MAQGSSGVQVWVWRLWAVGALQECVEAWCKGWLVDKFRSPYMCRVSVTDGRWCMVPSLTQAAARRVPAWMCQYDPWCGEVVFLDTAPPLITRLTVLLTALLVSLLVVWAPCLLTYRPTHPLLVWARRHTPRRVLVLVAVSGVLQLTLDHCLFAIMLPPRLLLSRLASLLSFALAQLLITAALVRHRGQSTQPLHTSPQVYLSHTDIPTTAPGVTSAQRKKEPWEATPSYTRASYPLSHTA